jgi:4'-phosphopantetheinyl transferase EntD
MVQCTVIPMKRTSDLTTIGLHWIAERLVACIVPIYPVITTLLPDEEPWVIGATLRRRAQFAAGRDAARQVMAAMGASVVGVGQGIEGEPLFPAELRGSISHTRAYAVALVGFSDDYCSLGVDLDDAQPLGDAAAAGVTWQAEISRIQRVMGIAGRAAAQNFAFSAKEAIFKCQYPLTLNSKLGHQQVRLLVSGPGADVMSVAGWRVAAPTATILNRVVVRRLMLGSLSLALATISMRSR